MESLSLGILETAYGKPYRKQLSGTAYSLGILKIANGKP